MPNFKPTELKPRGSQAAWRVGRKGPSKEKRAWFTLSRAWEEGQPRYPTPSTKQREATTKIPIPGCDEGNQIKSKTQHNSQQTDSTPILTPGKKKRWAHSQTFYAWYSQDTSECIKHFDVMFAWCLQQSCKQTGQVLHCPSQIEGSQRLTAWPKWPGK